MSITRGKSSNSTGFPRNCPVHPLFFAPHNRICQGQHWKPTRNWILHVLQNDRRWAVWGGCSYWHLASNPTDPGELSWKEKYPPFSQTLPANAICIQPAELFLPFVKMWQRLLFCAALPPPAPLRNESKWQLHCCKNSSLYSVLHKYTRRSTAGFNK